MASQRGIFGAALGPAAFDTLPGALTAFHRADGPTLWRGAADIDTGTSPPARAVIALMRLPRAGRAVPLAVEIVRRVDRAGPTEIWTRDFAGQRFSSTLRNEAGALVERFGPFAFTLGLAATPLGLTLPVVAWRCLRVPLPIAWAPRSQARESTDDLGRFCFDIRLTLPMIGLLTHYRGWLEPVADAGRR